MKKAKWAVIGLIAGLAAIAVSITAIVQDGNIPLMIITLSAGVTGACLNCYELGKSMKKGEGK